MGKRTIFETPLQRVDRLIWELRNPDNWRLPRHHAIDDRWHQYKALAREYYSVPVRVLVGAR